MGINKFIITCLWS